MVEMKVVLRAVMTADSKVLQTVEMRVVLTADSKAVWMVVMTAD